MKFQRLECLMHFSSCVTASVLTPKPPMLSWLKFVRRGVEMLADNLLCPDLDDTIRDFAAQLRKGGEQK